MEKLYFTYIITNTHRNVLYTGVTNNLSQRIYQHKSKLIEGFAKKYNVDLLVYYESYSDVRDAISREKQIKGWSRSKKEVLIMSANPEWRDLYDGWFI